MVLIAPLYGAGPLFGPAFDAIVPSSSPRRAEPANSLDQFIRPAAFRMLGPAVGGWLIAIFGHPGPAFLAGRRHVRDLDHVSPAHAVAVCPGDSDHGSMVSEIREGFRYVRTQVWVGGRSTYACLPDLQLLKSNT